MKTPILFFITAFAISGCNTKQEAPKNQVPKSAAIIVKDQSSSMAADLSSKQTQQGVHQYLKANFQAESDLLLSNIHAYSNAAVNHQLLSWKFKSTAQSSSDNKELEAFQQKKDDQKQWKQMEATVFTFLNTTDADAAHETAIIELLPQLQKQTTAYSSASLLFISDMIPESALCNLVVDGSIPFSSKQAAINKAEAVYQQATKEIGSLNEFFTKVKSISILVPASVAQKKIIYLDDFWQHFFQKAGYSGTVSWKSL